MNNITIIFDQNNTRTTFVVRSKNGVKPISNNYNLIPQIPIDNTLELLGLERVPLNEILPKYKQIKDESFIENNCSICQERFKLREYIRELKCSHIYHKKCIDKWLKDNLTCPYCRSDIIYDIKN